MSAQPQHATGSRGVGVSVVPGIRMVVESMYAPPPLAPPPSTPIEPPAPPAPVEPAQAVTVELVQPPPPPPAAERAVPVHVGAAADAEVAAKGTDAVPVQHVETAAEASAAVAQLGSVLFDPDEDVVLRVGNARPAPTDADELREHQAHMLELGRLLHVMSDPVFRFISDVAGELDAKEHEVWDTGTKPDHARMASMLSGRLVKIAGGVPTAGDVGTVKSRDAAAATAAASGLAAGVGQAGDREPTTERVLEQVRVIRAVLEDWFQSLMAGVVAHDANPPVEVELRMSQAERDLRAADRDALAKRRAMRTAEYGTHGKDYTRLINRLHELTLIMQLAEHADGLSDGELLARTQTTHATAVETDAMLPRIAFFGRAVSRRLPRPLIKPQMLRPSDYEVAPDTYDEFETLPDGTRQLVKLHTNPVFYRGMQNPAVFIARLLAKRTIGATDLRALKLLWPQLDISELADPRHTNAATRREYSRLMAEQPGGLGVIFFTDTYRKALRDALSDVRQFSGLQAVPALDLMTQPEVNARFATLVGGHVRRITFQSRQFAKKWQYDEAMRDIDRLRGYFRDVQYTRASRLVHAPSYRPGAVKRRRTIVAGRERHLTGTGRLFERFG